MESSPQRIILTLNLNQCQYCWKCFVWLFYKKKKMRKMKNRENVEILKIDAEKRIVD